MTPNQNKAAANSPKNQNLKNAASGSTNPVQCPICTETVPATDTQHLSCGHCFCTQCLSFCQNATYCPFFGCQSTRMADVLVDEIDETDDEPNEIAEKLNRVDLFGPRQPGLLKLEERQQ